MKPCSCTSSSDAGSLDLRLINIAVLSDYRQEHVLVPQSMSLTSEIELQIAKRQGVVNPENTFFSVKRFIGRKMSEVGSESQQMPYRLADSAGAVKIKSSNAGKDFSPEEISAQVLRKLVDDAAKFLNDKVH